MKKNVVLAVALFALIAVGVSAQQADPESDFRVKKDGNAITITGYSGTKTVVNIPSKIQNLPVTVIDRGFYGKKNITSVTIPNGVTSIVNAAFQNCQSLTSITIPNTVTTIGEGAFALTGLTSVTIPNSVTKIEDSAFDGCESLISVTFQGTITSANFGSINTFYGDLRAKYLAGGVGTYTTTAPLGGTSTWTKATATATPAQSGDPESDFQFSGGTITKYVGTKTEVNIPSKIQNITVFGIGQEAFANNKLTSVTIPNSVKSIGHFAFSGCSSLTSVTFGGQIQVGNFSAANNTFPGDLRAKFYAGNPVSGTAGTYTRPNGTSLTWTKK